MPTIIDLDAARRRRQGDASAAPRYLFDLASPWTYLTAAAVADVVSGVEWIPVLGLPSQRRVDREAVERHAAELGVRFVWPQATVRDGEGAPRARRSRNGAPLGRRPAAESGDGPTGRHAARVAALAAEQDLGPAFALAAARLTFGWGRDLDSLDVIAEAAGASGVKLSDALDAAFDPRRDDELERAAAHLDAVPALDAGGAPLTGERLATNLELAHPRKRGARR